MEIVPPTTPKQAAAKLAAHLEPLARQAAQIVARQTDLAAGDVYNVVRRFFYVMASSIALARAMGSDWRAFLTTAIKEVSWLTVQPLSTRRF